MLNELNLELQGKDKTVVNMISSVNAFKRKIQLLSSKLQRHDFGNFQNLASDLETQRKACAQFNIARYTEQIVRCLSLRVWQTLSRLHSCATHLGTMLRLKIATLFHLNSSEVEILKLQTDLQLKSRAQGQFWNLLTREKYPNMRKCTTSLTALFGSAYVCESAFSHMKIKSKYHSTMTDHHLEACLRLATSSCPDCATLADFYSVQVIRVRQ
ncbi:hypothetical protein AMELA_G00179400 [Ameiurus melas]|uniref:HAT C-terminal dimerisation domain-containing protein n=1 Tax=Ameiurus melas TaxID=219545 RepID=A0A7J6A9I8_AMEME|nr:hypothetical protein AMELA_G00179400 [Ameiurus melas]